MSVPLPQIDNRSFDDIVGQAMTLAEHEHYCPEWKLRENKDNSDPAVALVHLFAHLMEILITRLNRVPGKYFLAFLDYIGAKLRPPSPARALLQFTLAEGAAADQAVPAGTQIATEETPDLEEQVFETSGPLTVTPVKLIHAFTADPGNKPNDCTAAVTGIEESGVDILKTEGSAFYLGFDTPFSNDGHSLFIDVLENEGTSRRLQWEYSGSEGWERLTVKDDTQNLTKPGHVRFMGPEDFSGSEKVGLHLYWLRVRQLDTAAPLAVTIQRVYMNSVWAENVETIKDELLGSGDGTAGQTFKLKHAPVLPGQQLWVTEREMIADHEYQTITREEGQDAVNQIRVRWHEVANFYSSGPRSRHYMMEPSTGVIYFGDGTRGMAPPLGTDNLQCMSYRTGGGIDGNVKPGKITQLRTSLPYIDSVTNVLPAGGGLDGETLEELELRGPFMLKHRDRAVTAEDFEWMMKEAPGDIAMSKCIPARDWSDPGKVDVIIVPDLDEPKPFPPEALIGKVEQYLAQRCFAALVGADGSRVKVKGPGYLEISVDAGVVPKDIQQAGIVEERVTANLERFFHPLKGGPGNNGWTFGRSVHLSEVMEVIQDTEGVDFVKRLQLIAPYPIYNLTLTQPIPLYFPAGSVVSSRDGSIAGILAEEVEETDKLIVWDIEGTGVFKRHDTVVLRCEANPGHFQECVIEDIDSENPVRIYLEPDCLVYSGKHNIEMLMENS